MHASNCLPELTLQAWHRYRDIYIKFSLLYCQHNYVNTEAAPECFSTQKQFVISSLGAAKSCTPLRFPFKIKQLCNNYCNSSIRSCNMGLSKLFSELFFFILLTSFINQGTRQQNMQCKDIPALCKRNEFILVMTDSNTSTSTVFRPLI